jgi:FkbM family methyltransferase
VFLDIGANIGYYSMLVAHASRRRASVHAFEPVDRNFAALNRNRDLNGLSSIIHTYRTAISGTVGEAEFRLPPGTNRGIGSLCPSSGSAQTGHRVKTTTIDYFAQEKGLDRVSCIKIDVEGAEALVISGGTETIRRWQPILMIEDNRAALARFGASEQSLLETLRGLGYRVYYAPHDRLEQFEHLPAALPCLNLFCLPAGTNRGGR